MSFGNEQRADPHEHFRAGPKPVPVAHDHSAGLTGTEVMAKVGSRWEEFAMWIARQTVGVCPRGCSLYYRGDVENFLAGGKVLD